MRLRSAAVLVALMIAFSVQGANSCTIEITKPLKVKAVCARVVDWEERTVEGALVVLRRDGEKDISVEHDEDGTYRAVGLPKGKYRLIVRQRDEQAVIDVQVTGGTKCTREIYVVTEPRSACGIGGAELRKIPKERASKQIPHA
jgi:hypothetical protein